MSEGGQLRRHLLLTYRTGNAFTEAYREDGPARGLFVPGALELQTGDTVDIELVFADDLMVFHTRGIVLECRSESRALLKAGVRVDFLPTEERTRFLILEFAHGRNRQTIRRRPRRFPIQVEIDFATDEMFTPSVTDDLSKSGAFLLSEELLDAGTLVALRLRPADRPAITINAEVAWRQLEPRRGFGVRFLLGDPDKQQQIDELLDHLMSQQKLAGDED